MLIQGGSSFNALVRAMKQELIDSGSAAKDPALLFEIDKVCRLEIEEGNSSISCMHTHPLWAWQQYNLPPASLAQLPPPLLSCA
jgi:hypothetical protein